MEENSTKLSGMNAIETKEYIFGYIATLKLTEKEIIALEEEAGKWKDRIELARSRGRNDLLVEAEKEVERVNAKLTMLCEEAAALRSSIDTMRRQLPGIAARTRSIDVDLLEQELLMALGRSEEEAETERAFAKLEKEEAVDAALEALKARLD